MNSFSAVLSKVNALPRFCNYLIRLLKSKERALSMKNSFAVLSVAIAFSTSLVAKEVTWTGGGSGWADQDNWSDAPQDGDIAVIPENVTATVKSADIDAFRAFGGYRLEAGSTLFLDAVSFFSYSAFDKPLTGSGTLLAVGGSLYLKSDNSAFDGKFAFTNNYVEVHSTSALGTTNEVWLGRTGANGGTLYHMKIDRVDGPNAVTNIFHFGAPNGRSYVLESIKSPLKVYGPVFIDAGWCQFVNDSGYWSEYYGGIYGGGYMFAMRQQGNPTVVDCEVDLPGGGLVADEGGYVVSGALKRGELRLNNQNRGFVFTAPECCRTNDVWVGDWAGLTPTGGFLDLGGHNQTIANVCDRIDTYNTTEPRLVFKSEAPATLTMVGTPTRRYAANTFVATLDGAISLCYDWDGRAGIKAYLTGHTDGLFKFTSESPTSGGIICKRGDFRIEATATLPNLTALGVSNTGKMTVSANGIGEEGEGLVVTVADSGVLTIGADVTIAAKSACIGGKWIDPKPGETYGGPDSAATVKLDGLAGKGILTVAEYGGPKGLMLLFK